MKAIRKRHNGYAVLLAISLSLTVWFSMKPMAETALVFGAASIAMFLLLVRQSRLLYDASLIWDNRILAVPSVVVTTACSKEHRETEETVVSTFGILIGSRIYKWGCNGVRGVRLNTIEIDRARIYLNFGDGAETTRVELLHGLTDEQAALEVKQRMWHETGVTARLSNW